MREDGLWLLRGQNLQSRRGRCVQPVERVLSRYTETLPARPAAQEEGGSVLVAFDGPIVHANRS